MITKRSFKLTAEDRRNLTAATQRKGYALPRFNRRTGVMLTAQWRSWLKLCRAGFASIAPNGGEAEELTITPEGRKALRDCIS